MKASDLFQNAALGVLAGCAVTVTALVVRRELSTQPIETSRSPVRTIDRKLAVELDDGGHVIGSKTARVHVVEFADMECPYCARAEGLLDSVTTVFGGHVAVRFRHYPLSEVHPQALEAAVASECAADEGRFAAFLHVAYSKQDSLGLLNWVELSRRAGVLDSERFMECLRDAAPMPRVERDMQAGRRLGVRGTPTFVIGRIVETGLPAESMLVEDVRQALQKHGAG